MLFDQLLGKKEKKNQTKKKEKENNQQNTEQFENHEIFALSVDSKEGLKEALDEFKKGTPTLVGIKDVRKKGLGKTEDLVNELLSFTNKREGRILGVGKNYLLLSPENYDLNVKEL